jgi:hypothetical protein
MAKRYRVHFILCEDIRIEANGKVNLSGIYPGEIVLLLKNELHKELPKGAIAVLPNLAFVFFVSGPEGRLSLKVKVVGPDKDQLVETPSMDTTIDKGTATIGFTGSAIVLPKLGKYAVHLYLGEEIHEFDFEIKGAPGFVTTGTAQRRKVASKKTKKTSREPAHG